MRGDLVIVRAFGNRPLLRRVWDATSTRVYVLDEDSFQRRQANKDALAPMGWPRDVVFYHDEKLLTDLVRGYKANPTLWKQLKIYRESNGKDG